MICIETKRLLLRNVKEKDVETMFDYRNNEICAKFQRGQTKDFEGIRQLIEKRKNDEISLENPFFIAVCKKESDQMVGEIVVMPNDGTISIGYTFHYRQHRKGFAYESLSALTNLLRQKYPTWDFISFTHPDNIPSMALLKKLGYKDMGYIPHLDSQVFGKWTTLETEKEIAQAVKPR